MNAASEKKSRGVEAVRTLADRLAHAGVAESRLKAELLFEDALGVSRLVLADLHVRALSSQLQARLDDGAGRLAAGEPIQYVLGWTSFLGHRIACDRRALIPRPETEELVEAVLKVGRCILTPPPPHPRRGRDTAPYRIADVGTGTGCIAIALDLAWPDAEIVATDLSDEALELARENATALGADIEFVRDDLLASQPDESFDIIVSNPPYIASDDLAGLDRNVRDFEPRAALDGGFQGLEILDRLISNAWKKLKPSGRLFLEIGAAHGDAIRTMLLTAGFSEIDIQRDLAGHDRIASGTRHPTPDTRNVR